LCSEEVRRRDDLITSLEKGNCKPCEAQINKIEHEIELNWRADVEELTILHKVNLQEAERKLEMIRAGANHKATAKLKQAGEMHAREKEELEAEHQEALERILGEVGEASDKIKQWERERKTIVDAALLLEAKAKKIKLVS